MAHSGFVPQTQNDAQAQAQLILLKRNLESADRMSLTYKYRNSIYRIYAQKFHRFSNSTYHSQNLADLLLTLNSSNILLAQLSNLAKVLSDNPRNPANAPVSLEAIEASSNFDKAVAKCYVQGLDAAYNLLVVASIKVEARDQLVLISNALGDTIRLYVNPCDHHAADSLAQTQRLMPRHSYLRPIAGTFLVVLGILTLAAAIAANTILGMCLMAGATGLLLSIGVKMLATDVSDISKSTDQLLRARNTFPSNTMFASGPPHQNFGIAVSAAASAPEGGVDVMQTVNVGYNGNRM